MTDDFYDEPQEWENPKETMNEPQLSEEIEQIIIDYAYNYKDIAMAQEDLQKLLKEVVSHCLATALEEQATRHAMLMAGLEAQIEQKAIIRASELVDKARATERIKVLEEVDGMITEVELVNESNGRYNACQELKAKLNQLKGGK